MKTCNDYIDELQLKNIKYWEDDPYSLTYDNIILLVRLAYNRKDFASLDILKEYVQLENKREILQKKLERLKDYKKTLNNKFHQYEMWINRDLMPCEIREKITILEYDICSLEHDISTINCHIRGLIQKILSMYQYKCSSCNYELIPFEKYTIFDLYKISQETQINDIIINCIFCRQPINLNSSYIEK